MEDQTDKYMKEMFKDLKLETPSKDFTKHVMNKLNFETEAEIQTGLSFYSKYKFPVIFSLTFFIIFIVAFFYTDEQIPGFIDELTLGTPDLSIFEKIKDFLNPGFKLSLIHYIIMAAGLLLFAFDSFIPRIRNSFLEK